LIQVKHEFRRYLTWINAAAVHRGQGPPQRAAASRPERVGSGRAVCSPFALA